MFETFQSIYDLAPYEIVTMIHDVEKEIPVTETILTGIYSAEYGLKEDLNQKHIR